MVDAIMRGRNNEIYVKPGYDGEYGVPVFDEKAGDKVEKAEKKDVDVVNDEPKRMQKGLDDFC